MDLDQYDVVSLTDALRGFLEELPTPIIPTTVYSELVYTAQGTEATQHSADVNPDEKAHFTCLCNFYPI